MKRMTKNNLLHATIFTGAAAMVLWITAMAVDSVLIGRLIHGGDTTNLLAARSILRVYNLPLAIVTGIFFFLVATIFTKPFKRKFGKVSSL